MKYLGARGTQFHDKKPEVENLVSDSLRDPELVMYTGVHIYSCTADVEYGTFPEIRFAVRVRDVNSSPGLCICDKEVAFFMYRRPI